MTMKTKLRIKQCEDADSDGSKKYAVATFLFGVETNSLKGHDRIDVVEDFLRDEVLDSLIDEICEDNDDRKSRKLFLQQQQQPATYIRNGRHTSALLTREIDDGVTYRRHLQNEYEFQTLSVSTRLRNDLEDSFCKPTETENGSNSCVIYSVATNILFSSEDGTRRSDISVKEAASDIIQAKIDSGKYMRAVNYNLRKEGYVQTPAESQAISDVFDRSTTTFDDNHAVVDGQQIVVTNIQFGGRSDNPIIGISSEPFPLPESVNDDDLNIARLAADTTLNNSGRNSNTSQGFINGFDGNSMDQTPASGFMPIRSNNTLSQGDDTSGGLSTLGYIFVPIVSVFFLFLLFLLYLLFRESQDASPSAKKTSHDRNDGNDEIDTYISSKYRDPDQDTFKDDISDDERTAHEPELFHDENNTDTGKDDNDSPSRKGFVAADDDSTFDGLENSNRNGYPMERVSTEDMQKGSSNKLCCGVATTWC